MKTLYVLGFFLLAINTQLFAYQKHEVRIDSTDKKELSRELQKGLEEFKAASGGKIDFKALKPLLADRLADFYEARVVTMEELKLFEQQYNAMAQKYATATTSEKEQALTDLFAKGFQAIENNPLKKLKAGEICNKWNCEHGLDCATVPPRLQNKFKFPHKCSLAGNTCSTDNQCCSGVCELKSKKIGNKEKIIGRCQPTMRCFKPAKLNSSCQNTATCQNGDCTALDWGYAGTNECQTIGTQCQKNIDCCSNKCEHNKCVDNFICTNCLRQGEQVKRGRKCCEGLYPNLNGKCVKEVPPLVIPGFSYIQSFINILFPSAQADEVTNQAKAFIQKRKSSDRGESFDQVFKSGYGKDEFKRQKDVNARVKAAVNQATGGGKKYQSVCQGSNANRKYYSMDSDGKKRYDEKGNPIMVTCEQHQRELQQQGLNNYMRTPKFPIGPKSDFKTCKINFKNDYLHFLDKQNLLNLEFALAGFEYVMLGSGIDDYWKQGNRGPTIYQYLKKVADEHRKHRNEIFKTIQDKEDHLRCLCLDRIGYPRIENATDKEWFKDNCKEEYSNYEAQLEAIKQQYSDYDPKTMWEGDPTGVKYKEMIIDWTGALAEYQAALADINSQTFEASYNFSKLTNEYNWNQTEIKRHPLYDFTVFPFNGGVPSTSKLKYSLGAILAAGAVAIVAGIGGPAFLTTWAAAGIITGSAVTGITAQWAINALRGAWTTQPPIIEDEITRSSYKCTKKGARCQDYKRVIYQPVNRICGDNSSSTMPFNANACIRHFIAVPRELTAADKKYIDSLNKKDKAFQKKQLAYSILVDPWIPWEPKGENKVKALVIKDKKEHVQYLKEKVEGRSGAIARLKKTGPATFTLQPVSKYLYDRCTGKTSNSSNYYYSSNSWECQGATFIKQNGHYYKKVPTMHIGTHINVSIGYLSAPFLDATKVGYYVPNFANKDAKQYILSDEAIKLIKKNAMKYIVDEAALLQSKDLAAQKAFADYVFKYHFVWPRTSRPGTIMYPPQSFLTYLDLIAHGFGTISYSNVEAYSAYRQRQKEYIDNLLNTMPALAQSSLMTNKQREEATMNHDRTVDNLKKQSSYFKNFRAVFNKAKSGTVTTMSGSKLDGQKLNTSDTQALHAVNRLTKIRKEQLKEANHFKKVAGNSPYAKKMENARKDAINNFYTPAAGDKGFQSFSNFADRIGLSSATDNQHEVSNSVNSVSGHHGIKRNFPGTKAYHPNYNSSSNYNSASSETGSNTNTDNPVKGQDAEKIADALNAIQQDKSAIDTAADGQGLFDIVTKAYFRSYKRIFSPKKLEPESDN